MNTEDQEAVDRETQADRLIDTDKRTKRSSLRVDGPHNNYYSRRADSKQ